MSVYKEGYAALKFIQGKQKRIFKDAIDFGAPTKKGDEVWNEANSLCTAYEIKGTRVVSRYHTGRSVRRQVLLIDEWAVSDERKTVKQATEKFEVSFTSCDSGACKGYDGYITITKL